MVYESSKYVYNFRRFWTIRSFGDAIFTGKITLSEANKKQSNLLDVISNFNNKVRPRSKVDKEKKSNSFESANVIYQDRELILNAFKSGISPIKATQGEGLQILART